MKNIIMKKRFVILLICSWFIGSAVLAQPGGAVKNVVLVHGAFADGSGWEGVFKLLTAKGYNVSVVQNPLMYGLEGDVDAVKRVLDKQDGPTVLVGHSWGGSVITQAGVHPKVVSLVYVAALAPDAGETTISQLQWAPPAPENGILPPDENGFVYYDKAKFHKGFCGDLSAETAAFMWASQGATAAKGFGTPLTEAAWKTKPSWAVIATEDKSINPEILRRAYKRAGSTVTEVKGASHVVFISQPKVVAAVIEAAAKGKE